MGIDLAQLLADAEKRYGARGGGAGGGLGSLFKGGAVAEQLLVWGVLNQLLGTVLAPPLMFLSRGVNSEMQAVPLSPPLLADLVVRNVMSDADATNYAKQSGVSPEDFARMVKNAGEPPSPQEMLAAYRRGLVPLHGRGPDEVSVEQAVAESRLFTKYTDTIIGLSDVPIGVADAVDAVVESQITFDQGAAIAYLSGISRDNFNILYHTRGNPPSPTELLELWKRGIIDLNGTGQDAVTVEQGIAEGATKNKWFKPLTELARYVPPPRTIVAMVREGSIDDAAALAFLRESGLTDELAGAYLTSAHHQKTATERQLTVANIAALYKDSFIDATEAAQLLALLKYSTEDAAFLIDLWGFEALQAKTRTAVSRIHSLYVAHKIDATEASTTLDSLGIPAAGRDEMLTVWNLERDANVPILTRVEIVDAWYYDVLTTAEADARLEALGWSAEDAAILRGIRAHGKQRPSGNA